MATRDCDFSATWVWEKNEDFQNGLWGPNNWFHLKTWIRIIESHLPSSAGQIRGSFTKLWSQRKPLNHCDSSNHLQNTSQLHFRPRNRLQYKISVFRVRPRNRLGNTIKVFTFRNPSCHWTSHISAFSAVYIFKLNRLARHKSIVTSDGVTLN